MGPMYYRGAAAAIVVFDITSEDSFTQLQQWVDELRKNSDENIVLAIACNKCDLSGQRAVAFKRAKEYAESVGAIVYETSAKANKGIEDLFVEISRKIIANKAAPPGAVAQAPASNIKLDGEAAEPAAKGRCGC